MTHPPEIDKDLEKMISKAIPVHVVSDAELLSGITRYRAATCLRFSIGAATCGTGDLTLIEPSRLS